MSFNITLQNYAITITPNLRDRVYYAEDFIPLLDNLKKYGIEVLVSKFEMKKNKILHLHIAAIGPTGLYFIRLQKAGWQVFIKVMTDESGWLDYITKTSVNNIEEEQLLQTHYLIHNSPLLQPFLDMEE